MKHSVLSTQCLWGAFAFNVLLATNTAVQTVTPPNAPGMTVPFPYLYLNAPTHWDYMYP